MEWVELSFREVICESNQPLRHAFFPVSGMCSTIVLGKMDGQVESGLIGREGFVGAPILLMAGQAPQRVVVQGPGRALRLPAARLIEAANDLPEFRTVLLRFIHTFLVQFASTLLANSTCLVEERLARWLLMSHDRMESAKFPITHEQLAIMLAVRRAGVTEAVHSLESRGMIRASRGHVQILDRTGLEALAEKCYGQAEREYQRLIHPMSPQAA
jgi:CRP-like cAMP-binding protein